MPPPSSAPVFSLPQLTVVVPLSRGHPKGAGVPVPILVSVCLREHRGILLEHQDIQQRIPSFGGGLATSRLQRGVHRPSGSGVRTKRLMVSDDVRKQHGAARTCLILGVFSTVRARALHVSESETDPISIADGPHAPVHRSAKAAIACSMSSSSTCRWVTARNMVGPRSSTSTPRSARAATASCPLWTPVNSM